jgi:hypothetical protein
MRYDRVVAPFYMTGSSRLAVRVGYDRPFIDRDKPVTWLAAARGAEGRRSGSIRPLRSPRTSAAAGLGGSDVQRAN